MGLRGATLSDLPEICELEKICFGTEEAFSRRLLRSQILNPQSVFRIARVRGQLVAFCIGRLRKHPRHFSGRIYDVAVRPDFRGRGLAKALVCRVLRELTQGRARCVYLEVREDNYPAIALYEALGFVKIRELADYYGKGVDGQSMRRPTPGHQPDQKQSPRG